MVTTSPLARVTVLPLCFKLCCSRKHLRYSDDHLPHSTSLHFFRYHALMIRSLFSNWWFCVSGNNVLFYVAQRAVILGTPTSWSTSCRSPQVSIPFPTVLLKALLTRPTILSIDLPTGVLWTGWTTTWRRFWSGSYAGVHLSSHFSATSLLPRTFYRYRNIFSLDGPF